MTEYLHRKYIFILLGISFVISIIGDLMYNGIEVAEQYMVGNFLLAIQGFTISLVIIFSILYLVVRIIFKDVMDSMFCHPYRYVDFEKKVEKKKRRPSKQRSRK